MSLTQMDPGPERVACGNCEWEGTADDCAPIKNLEERIDAGGEVPAGECPECGALAYIVDETDPIKEQDALVLADWLKRATIQDVIKAYGEQHPDAVATPAQVQRACDLHAGDEISVDAEAFLSPVEGEGFHVMGWLWVPDEEIDSMPDGIGGTS